MGEKDFLVGQVNSSSMRLFNGCQPCFAKIVKAMAVLVLSLFSTASLAQQMTQHSEYLFQLQNEFQNANPRHTIVYMDREILAERFAAKGVSDPREQFEMRNKIVAEFVKERVGTQIDPINADTLGDYLLTGSAVAVPLKSETGQGDICAVFGSKANSTALAESERILYWKQMGEKTDEYHNHHIKPSLTAKQFALLTDLHETFHCLDPYYVVKQDTNEYENQDTIHRAESFAEIGALLYLAGKGFRDLGPKRVLYRIVGSYMAGRYGDDLIGPNIFTNIEFGVVYSFYPAIFDAQNYIESGIIPLDLQTIIEFSQQIVEQNALSATNSQAIAQTQSDPELLKKMIKEFKNDDNEYFRERFSEIDLYREEYEEVLQWAFEQLIVEDDSATRL